MFIHIFFFLLFFFSAQSWGFKSRNTHSVSSSTNQMCDSSYLNHQFSVLWLFQILLVLSLLIYLLLQHSFFPNHHLFSYLLLLSLNRLSHFSQLLHISDFPASLGSHHPSNFHLLWIEDTPGLYIWPQYKSLLPLFRMKHSISCHTNKDFVQDE